MPTCILKLVDPRTEEEWYMEWSTVVDAPVSAGMTRTDFTEYYRKKYGKDSAELGDRMARVDKTGTSFHGQTAANVIVCNRAGPKEKKLGVVGIINRYCKPD